MKRTSEDFVPNNALSFLRPRTKKSGRQTRVIGEIRSEAYNAKADSWSLGITCIEMVALACLEKSV